MGFFTKDEESGRVEIKNLEVTLKKSMWEKISGIFWGLVKIGFLLAVAGIFFGENTLPEAHENTLGEKKYFDSYFREQTKKSESLHIGVLNISGMITSSTTPAFSQDFTNAESFIALLVDAIEDEEIDALVLRIDSPGGEVLATEKITTIIDILREKSEKKIYVLLEGMAASGGYYIATSGEKIFAYPETLLGNIGVRIDIPNASELLKKVGVEMKSVTSGEMKTMGSPFREMTEEEEAVFSALIEESYEKFVGRVAKGRNLSLEETKKLADGRIFSGTQGKENGLVDVLISSFPELAMEISVDMKQEDKDVQFIEFLPRLSPLEKLFMGVSTNVSQLKSSFFGVPAQKTEFLMQ